MASGRRCHYEVLGLSRDCTADEIRSAYRKLALQLHPDKLVQSGLSQSEATAKFQELVQAYEVLSDPKERAWYDSHRSQILFADPSSANSVPDSVIPNLFSFFSNTVFSGYSDVGRGFYKVYSDLFNKIYGNEINFATKLGLGAASIREAPAMGNLESPYAQVTAFYGYWLGFVTVMDFCWVDQYDAMAGPNRKSRRVMEDENKKLRKKAKREYNETVRGLAEFVKKRDKRVIDMMVKKNLEMEKKREEEKARKKKLEKERLERVMAYQEPDWAKVDEEEEEDNEFEDLEEEKKRKELYCVFCGKKFKSDKQWKNHEQSKKHREKVAEFRDSIGDEDFEDTVEGEEEVEAEVDDGVDELGGQIRDGFQIKTDDEVGVSDGDDFYDVEDAIGSENVGGDLSSNNEDEAVEGEGEGKDDLGLNKKDNGDVDVKEEEKEGGQKDDNDDDQIGILEAMLAGRKNRKNALRREHYAPSSTTVENDGDEVDLMDYNNRRSTRRNRGAKKERGKKNSGEKENNEINENDNNNNQSKDSNGDDDLPVEEPSSSFSENGSNGVEDDRLLRNKKTSNQRVDKKGTAKSDSNVNSKNSTKGKKAKATLKYSSNTCETCGEEFESKTKLHKHLGASGHAAPKYR
ncbi:hypothetical protein UlMin_008396 [Ulmus minor]